MSQTSKLRRTIMTLSHREVLNILTNVQEPRCALSQITGIRADLSAVSSQEIVLEQLAGSTDSKLMTFQAFLKLVQNFIFN